MILCLLAAAAHFRIILAISVDLLKDRVLAFTLCLISLIYFFDIVVVSMFNEVILHSGVGLNELTRVVKALVTPSTSSCLELKVENTPLLKMGPGPRE
jgi:hypothetical protein